MSELKTIDNISIFKDHIVVSVNEKIYPLDIIYSAAYVFMDKAYIVLSGGDSDEVIITLRPKKEMKQEQLEEFGRDFNNELVNYAVFKEQAASSRNIKESIVNSALNTGVSDEESFEDDPLGIAVPWEEKNEEQNG
ncbi:MAG: hypothetical protein MAG795_00489 [Candidatus Woesearchaeota archaeon]|nr:hypothetical protein [Candidatus Woesearchaeota archaeon]